MKEIVFFTFSIPCITVQLLQIKPDSHNCIRYTMIL